MPSHSEKQAKFMAAACNNPEFAKKVGMDKKVACDFHKADKKEHKYFEDQLAAPGDKIDTVKFDVPTLIRILEIAREDIKDDDTLHRVVEQLIKVQSTKDVISMDDIAEIEKIAGEKTNDKMKQLVDQIIKNAHKTK